MRNQSRVWVLGIVGLLLAASVVTYGSDQKKSVILIFADGRQQTFALTDVSRIEFKDAAIIVFKDGRQKTFSLSEVARIEFEPAGSNEPQFGRNHYLGKWEVGDGAGSHFFITLEADGNARKTIGSNHGTWTVVNGEARISWDDGWHDAIRKAGSKHEKAAFEPGRSFTDEPSNVTDAKNTNPQPI